MQLLLPHIVVLPFPKRQIFYSSKLKEFANENSKSDENVGKFSKRVENTGKWGNCSLRPFSHFATMFSKDT